MKRILFPKVESLALCYAMRMYQFANNFNSAFPDISFSVDEDLLKEVLMDETIDTVRIKGELEYDERKKIFSIEDAYPVIPDNYPGRKELYEKIKPMIDKRMYYQLESVKKRLHSVGLIPHANNFKMLRGFVLFKNIFTEYAKGKSKIIIPESIKEENFFQHIIKQFSNSPFRAFVSMADESVKDSEIKAGDIAHHIPLNVSQLIMIDECEYILTNYSNFTIIEQKGGKRSFNALVETIKDPCSHDEIAEAASDIIEKSVPRLLSLQEFSDRLYATENNFNINGLST